MGKSIDWEPPGIESLKYPTSEEIDEIISTVQQGADQSVRDAIGHAIAEYRAEPDYEEAASPHMIRQRLTDIRDQAARLSEMICPYLIRQEILDLVADFNKTKRESGKLDLIQFSAFLESFMQALGRSKPSAPDRETAEQRIYRKLMVAYESLCGKALKIQGDEYRHSGVADGPPLRFMHKALGVAGHHGVTDGAIRSAVRRHYKRDTEP